ncbi:MULTISPECIES: hypothetical protein [unclassified Beijerinckia]|uniref:hypothetical protein n=1 Tax=unclassified Beijerinckia TaxID=2638183 RepID=UPI000894C2A7|nr:MULTISPECIES: hypothetical protein [unclassified Beijerinckia]MDH7796460.1 hypothetical protein [Beijerinckia sp. GAS462]SEC46036.1 hypothetical protein SAMN05443249_2742 [Beijerinckia sp. 28-YEA-48]
MAGSFRSDALKAIRAQQWLIPPEIQLLEFLIQQDALGEGAYADALKLVEDSDFGPDIVQNIWTKVMMFHFGEVLHRMKEESKNVQDPEVQRDLPVDGENAPA